MDTLDQSLSSGDNLLNSVAQEYLRGTVKWLKFLGIIGMIGGAMLVLFGFFFTTIIGMASQLNNPGMELFASMGIFATLIYVALGVLTIWMSYQEYSFGSKAAQGLNSKDATLVAEGFRHFKRYYTVKGVLAAIVVGFYVLAFVIGIIGGIAGLAM